jgi:integrase/recombinase XerD
MFPDAISLHSMATRTKPSTNRPETASVSGTNTGTLLTLSAGLTTPVKRTRRTQKPAAVYLARLAPGSRRTMREALNTIAGLLTDGRQDAETLPWAAVRYEHSQAIRAKLAERYAAATANKILAALRGVLREAWRLQQMNAEDFHRATDLPAVKGSPLPRGRALNAGELRALFTACAEDASPAGRRDAALLAVLYGAGIRRAEAVALDLADYEMATGALTIRRGKGNKDRMGYASNGSKEALDAWLLVRGNDPGPLFIPINRGGNMTLRRMTDHAIWKMVQKRAAGAGVKKFSPHDLRRSFCSDLLDMGADIAVVQQLAGHSNIATTARYDRRGEKAKQKAAEMLLVPYVPSA